MDASLLKYPWSTYLEGRVELASGWPAFGVLVLLCVVGVLLALRYGRAAPGRRGLWLTVLRVTALVGLLFVLMDPRLVVSTARSERGGVAVLLDDSASMRIAGRDGATRGRQMLDRFAPGSGDLADALRTRFDTRFYSLGAGAVPLAAGEEMTFSGGRLDLAAALEEIRVDGPLPSAVVLVTDGAPAADSRLERALLGLRAAGVVLHAVQVATDLPSPDLAVVEARVPARALRGDTVSIEVRVARRGVGAARAAATVTLEDEGLLVDSQQLDFEPQAATARTRLKFRAARTGTRRLRVNIVPLEGEVWLANNERLAVLDVGDQRIDVLHYEAEPRFEVKFVRRAAGADSNLRVVSLVRTAENKFYRLGVEQATDLAEGFPRDPEVLFDYEVVVLGSVGAEDLDAAQLQALTAFVERRGGGLLALGGRRALAEGGVDAGPLAALLPITLGAPRPGFLTRVTVSATRAGAVHEVAALALGTAESMPFEILPPLAVVNPVTGLKPGGTLLLTGRSELLAGRELVILATQRFGRGRVAVMPVRDTWRWQMHASVPLEDQSHELLWRRLLRYLGRNAPERLNVTISPRTAAPGQPVTLEAEVLDAAFRPARDVQLSLAVRLDDGPEQVEPVAWEAIGQGLHRASTVAPPAGIATFTVRARSGPSAPAASARSGQGTGDAVPATVATLAPVEWLQEVAVLVREDGREFDGRAPGADAELQAGAGALARLARTTGGRYFGAGGDADVETLADAVTVRNVEDDSLRRLPLHDVPALLLILVVLFSAEWLLRWRWSLA